MTEYHRPQLLQRGVHDRSAFDSRAPTLDDWLRRFAGQNRRGNTAATWVITDRNDIVVAYASLSMTGIDRTNAPVALTRNAPDPIPALLIGRLAVDHRHQHQGLGTRLVAHLLATAIALNEHAACTAIVVTALNEQAHHWWQTLGFTPLDPHNPTNTDLYLLTKDIHTTLTHPPQ